MKDLPDKHIIEEALEQICTNESFEKSPRNVRLMRFLVQQALEGKDVKEQVIGFELFEHNYAPEKNDAKVRVYMYNLRKKLEEYYENDGKNSAIAFKIEKGQYNLSFQNLQQSISNESEAQKPLLLRKFSIKTLLLVIAAIILTAISVYLIVHKKTSYCWHVFFDSSAQNICVISDHFLVEEQLEDGSWHARYIKNINNENDLIKYAHQNSNTKIRTTDYTFLTKMAPLTVNMLTKWFIINKSDFLVRLESEFRYEEARKNNIVFVGQFKTMTASKSLFLSTSKQFSIIDNGFTFARGDSVFNYHSNIVDKKRTDYAMVSFMILENGNKAFYFTSNNDIGTIATVRNFTNPVWLEEFYNKLPPETKFFNALFEVTGMVRTDMNCKLLHLEVLEEDV